MKKIRKAITAIMAVAMLSSVSVMPVSAESDGVTVAKIPTTIEEVAEFCEKVGVELSGFSEEQINEFYNQLLENGSMGLCDSRFNQNDENNIVSVLWNGYGEVYLGKDYGNFKYLIKDNEAYITRWADENATECVIPDEIEGCKVVGICGGAFCNSYGSAKNLERVVIPNTVRVIGTCAFECDENLKSVELTHPNEHSDLYTIGYWAFDTCLSLEEITCFKDSDLNHIGSLTEDYFSIIGYPLTFKKFAFPKQMRYDIDRNGTVDVKDLGYLKRYILKQSESYVLENCLMSPTGDDPDYVPDITDVVALKQYLVKLIDNFD